MSSKLDGITYLISPLLRESLSLKETCRLQARATYAVLVEAVTRFFPGQQPELSWITKGVHTAAGLL